MYEADCYQPQLLNLTFHDQEPQKAMFLLGRMREMEGRKKRKRRNFPNGFLLIKISKLVAHRESLISSNVALCSTTTSSNLTS